MNDAKLIPILGNHTNTINRLAAEFNAMRKVVDKTYMQSLTHVMMWDVLMGLLEQKGLITKIQFDEALKELSEKTRLAMEEAQKADLEKKKAEEGKVTILSDQPAIPVVP